jgi:uncharacterized protein
LRNPTATPHALTSLLLLSQNDRVKTDRLESFSIEELYSLADKMGLDLPPSLARLFIVEEILDALAEDSEDRRSSQGEAVHVDEKKFCGSELDDIEMDEDCDRSVESRYNETMIRAMVRDPSWAFAYWDVADSEIVGLRGDEPTAGLFLRVAEISPIGEDPASAGDAHKDYFDIPVADDDRQWYINLPRGGVRFRIDLCARHPGQASKTRVLARSNDVASPRQSLSAPASGLDDDRLSMLALSGIDELHIDGLEGDNPLRLTQVAHAGSPAESAAPTDDA